MFVHTMCVQCSRRPEEGVRTPRLVLQTVGNCHVDAGIYLGPLKEQSYPPSHLQPLHIFLRKENQGCVEGLQLSKATLLEQLVSRTGHTELVFNSPQF